MNNTTPKCTICLLVVLLVLVAIVALSSLSFNANIPPSNTHLSLNTVLLLTFFFGGFGGILQTLRDLFENAIMAKNDFDHDYLCKKNSHTLIGFLSGIGGAVALNFIFIGISKIEYTNDLKNFMFLVGLNTVGGFLGYKILSGVANKIEKDFHEFKSATLNAEKKIRNEVDLNGALYEASTSLNTKNHSDMELAKQHLLTLKDKHPTHRQLIISLGRIYRWLGEYANAIDVLSTFIALKSKMNEKDEAYAAALYNKACYNVLIYSRVKKDEGATKANPYKTKALEDLKEAVDIFPAQKKDASADEDFSVIKDTSEFIELTK